MRLQAEPGKESSALGQVCWLVVGEEWRVEGGGRGYRPSEGGVTPCLFESIHSVICCLRV